MKLLLNKKFLKIFLKVFVLFYVLTIVALLYIYDRQKKQTIQMVKEHTLENLTQRGDFIHALLNSTIPSLRYLSRQRSVINYLNQPTDKQELIRDMQLFAEYNLYYKQVRFINANGMEVIRVNWENDSLKVIPDSQLQNKAHRPYFQETMKLSPGQIYISDIDLNVEFGKVEVPHQRVIRFGTPIFDADNTIIGIIVINQYLNELFDVFEEQARELPGELMVLNRNGYWLFGPERFKSFGFMFDSLKNETFEHYYPKEWKFITIQKDGSIYNDRGLYVYHRVAINEDLLRSEDTEGVIYDESDLILLNYQERDAIGEINFLESMLWLALILSFIILFFISYVISKARYKEKIYVEELHTLNRELENKVKERTREISDKNEALAEVNDELESFTYSVSHDLRAPLRHINGFVDLLVKKNGPELTGKGPYYLNNIKDATISMSNLIEDLLNFSRIGRAALNYSTFDMNVLVKEVKKSAEQEYKKRDVKWKIEKMPHVSGDYSLLRQVWFNLISNALKYSSKKDHSRILIHSEINEEENEVIFSVKDNGEGFDMQYAHKLFGTFQRLHSSDDYEGTGIGLAIVRRIISKHGGRTWAEAELGVGATFYFSLPLK